MALFSMIALSALACSSKEGEGSKPGGMHPSGVLATGGGNGVLADGGWENGNGGGGPTATGNPGELQFVVRDFKLYDPNDPTTSPDFENVPDNAAEWPDREIVTDTIGPDNLPVYKNPGGTTLTTHGQASFDQWFRTVDGTNYPVIIPVTLSTDARGQYIYDSSQAGPLNSDGMFFPIDDGTQYATPFGNQTSTDARGRSHNFSFTLEIHTLFTYEGGEHFYFRGDDDVFVYINGQLVINLGGIHRSEEADVDIDTLGLTVGNTYNLDFFYTERHVVASDLLITTGLALINNTTIPIL
ncbi:MAG: fibro-slime domain-containing protein [Polyangiaceae bacterium]|nr:fibro-slime domain-containing protein [Polyangiaceae bacterium]